MDFGTFNLMGYRASSKSAAAVFAEVTEQTRLADELGYSIAWFAEHHFSNYAVRASPLMIEQILDNLPVGSVEHVADRLAAEIGVAQPAHICFNFQCGGFPPTAALRSMELFMTEVRPRLERALGPLDRVGIA